MRSIRLSLLVYFLLLEALALGAGSWLFYRTAERSLEAEQQTNRKLLVSQYEDQVSEARNNLDSELLQQARTLTHLTDMQFQFRKWELTRVMPLGLLSNSLTPQSHLTTPIWMASGMRSPLNTQLFRRLFTEISLSEDNLPRESELIGSEYFQISSEWGSVWRSRSMGDSFMRMDLTKLSAHQGIDWAFDDVELPSGQIGRRVQLRAPIARISFLRNPGPPDRPVGPPPRPRPTGNERFTEAASPWIIVQCACETDRRTAQVARLTTELASKITDQRQKAEAALQALNAKLLVIGVATFAATVLGGLLLISVGLSPLQRMSEAVSRVSPKDFRLPLDDKGLPSELTPIANRLRGTLSQLKVAFDREKQAVADISHELRTPVAAIMTTLDVALRKPRTADEYRATITEARAVSGHMRQLVERLLTLARLDSGAAQISIRPVDLAELMQQSLAVVRPLALEKGLALSSDVPAGLNWMTDPDKLREILINLLHNAIQYNRPEGQVRVWAKPCPEGVEVAVVDTGIGIKAEELPYVFERFYRTDPSRGEAALHAGLGLSIVRGYVSLLGGTIRVDSTFGSGTSFHIVLPNRPLSEQQREAA